jgi:dephospho-CoA kinase
MKKVGLTGGIGSGKSTVAAIFEVLGIPVYYADDAAKMLMNENSSLKESIRSAFGDQSYMNGELNRTYLSATVFSDPAKLVLLNSLVHPVTIEHAASWMKRQQAPYAIKEAALIFESDAHLGLDYVIGVSAPLETRIKRTMQRDHITEEQVLARMDKQMNEEEKLRLCDFIIINDESQLLIPQVTAIHARLMAAG